MFYFDNAASTKVLEEAAKAAYDTMLNYFANPSSTHSFGLDSENILNSCKKTLAEFFFREKEEFIFTSGATESINIAIFGTAKKNKHKKKIITSAVEHSATNSCLNILKEQGFLVVKIPPKNNRFYVEDFIDAIDESTFLISIMHVNNENGLILPVQEIAKKAKEKNKDIIIHIDAAQSFLKIPISLNNIDLLSACGHKINAPKGIGFLFIKKGTKISPIMFGGGQENNMRPGTQATSLIKAFDVAIKYHIKEKENLLKKYSILKKILTNELKTIKEIHFNFNEYCAPYIVNISIDGLKSQVLLQFLEENFFIISSKAACSKNKKNTALLNLGYSSSIADSAIRISFGIDSTKEQTLKLAEKIKIANKTLFKNN